jgi:hypothetical protein
MHEKLEPGKPGTVTPLEGPKLIWEDTIKIKMNVTDYRSVYRYRLDSSGSG